GLGARGRRAQDGVRRRGRPGRAGARAGAHRNRADRRARRPRPRGGRARRRAVPALVPAGTARGGLEHVRPARRREAGVRVESVAGRGASGADGGGRPGRGRHVGASGRRRRALSEQRWAEPSWLAEAHAWIRERVQVPGEIEQPHVRPWSTALRVPTPDGIVWFKASAAALAHDGPVTAALARIRPDAVLTPLALDVERGWSLLPDGGKTLRSVLQRNPQPRRWIEALALYSELQLDAAPHVDELVAVGLPDQRLAHIPELAEDIGVDDAAGLCAELAAFGLPESVQHDDCHDAN